jgi:hypothetical protein
MTYDNAATNLIIVKAYVVMLIHVHNEHVKDPAYKQILERTHDLFTQPHVDEELFHVLLGALLGYRNAEEGPNRSRVVKAALMHPDCPERYLRQALQSPMAVYARASFGNTSTPEEAKIAYWLRQGEPA